MVTVLVALLVCEVPLQLAVPHYWPERWQRGWLTRKFARAIGWPREAARALILLWLAAVAVAGIVAWLIDVGPWRHVGDMLMCTYLLGHVVLLVDDVLTGDDDDRWRRRWRAARNRVKWRMVLPAPATGRS